MSVVNYTLIALLFLLTPWGVMWLCRRFTWLGKIGTIMVLYAIGLLLGNLPFKPAEMAQLQELLPNIAVPLAIPMMLFGCHFTSRETSLQLKVCISGFASVAVAVACGYLLFGRHVAEGAEVGGIISGMYTGGTLNAAALQTIFDIESRTFVLINSYDIVISFLYFVFLFSCGIKLFRRLYGQSPDVELDATAEAAPCGDAGDTDAQREYGRYWSREGVRELATIVGLTLLVVALSAGVALLLPEAWFMVIFILLLTTLGVACSFVRRVRELRRSYDTGMYLIYIFSLAIASTADFSDLDLAGGLNHIAFMSFAVFVSLAIHALLCRMLRVDADSMVVSSVAFINSPPFVPMAVAAMRNRGVLLTGLGAGIVGYAVGTHFGVLMSGLLELLAL